MRLYLGSYGVRGWPDTGRNHGIITCTVLLNDYGYLVNLSPLLAGYNRGSVRHLPEMVSSHK